MKSHLHNIVFSGLIGIVGIAGCGSNETVTSSSSTGSGGSSEMSGAGGSAGAGGTAGAAGSAGAAGAGGSGGVDCPPYTCNQLLYQLDGANPNDYLDITPIDCPTLEQFIMFQWWACVWSPSGSGLCWDTCISAGDQFCDDGSPGWLYSPPTTQECIDCLNNNIAPYYDHEVDGNTCMP